MTGDWVAAIPAILVGVALVYVPGLLILSGLRMRGLALIAFAPVAGVAVVGASAVLLGLLPGVRWSPLSFSVVALALAAIAWALRPVLTRAVPVEPEIVRRWPFLTTAIGVGAAFIAFRLMSYVQSPENLSQTNDAVFHLNAIRFIEESGSASSLHVSGFIGGTGFYPAAWHGVVSLIAETARVDIPVAANAFTVVIGALIWTTGIAWLTRAMTNSTTAASYAAIIAGTLQTFPILMFQWGVLYPNALSTALVPAALTIVVELARWMRAGGEGRPVSRTVLGVLFVGIAMAALLISQPAAFLAWALLALVYVTFRAVGSSAAYRVRALIATGALWVALAVVWYLFSRSTSGSHWGPSETRTEAVIDMLTNSHVTLPASWAVSVLMLIGLVVAAWRSSTRWVAGAWLALAVLYVLVASAGRDIIRNTLLGAWYADPSRIAALVPIIAIPLAGIGLLALVRGVRRLIVGTDVPTVTSRVAFAAGGGIVAAGVATAALVITPVATPTFLEDNNVEISTYHPAAESYLSIDERTMLDDLDELVPADATVIGNPSTGMAFGYALSGRDVIPRTWSPPLGENWTIVAERLRDAASDPSVCEALAAFGAPEYVLDFGPGDTTPGRYVMLGMTDFAGQPGFTEVSAVGGASLWRIDACGA